MRIILNVLLALTFISFLLSCASDNNKVKRLDYKIDTVDVLGNNINKSSKYLFGWPGDIEVDKEGSFYVSDIKSLTIKKYNSRRKFVMRIGKEGRGPGEFQDIRSIEVHGGDLFVLGRGKITRFTTDGELIDTYRVNSNIAKIESFTSSNIIIMGYAENKESLITVYDDSSLNKVGNILEKNKVVDNNLIERSRYRSNPGNVSAITTDRILYAPTFYDGKIVELKKMENNWVEVGKWAGYIQKEEPYSKISKPEVGSNVRGYSHILTSDGEVNYVINNKSLNIFRVGNKVLHFTLIKRRNVMTFGCEVFDSSGNSLRYIPIKDISLNRIGGMDELFPIVKANYNNSFYIIERYHDSIPKVIIIKFSVVGLS